MERSGTDSSLGFLGNGILWSSRFGSLVEEVRHLGSGTEDIQSLDLAITTLKFLLYLLPYEDQQLLELSVRMQVGGFHISPALVSYLLEIPL